MHEPQHITSRQNQRVKEVVRLRGGRERRQSGKFLIDGSREIYRAIKAGIRCVEAYVSEQVADTNESRQALDAIAETGMERYRVTADVFAKIGFGERDEGLLVVARHPQRTLANLRLPPQPIVAVIEGVEKPGNVGAVLRSADAAGVDAVIVASGRTDLYNPNTIRASLGTVFRENVCEATSEETIAWLRTLGLPIMAARPDAKLQYNEADYSQGAAIVLGSEAEGLTNAWHGTNMTPIRVPMLGMADSLNVSTTAAVLFYEALRARSRR